MRLISSALIATLALDCSHAHDDEVAALATRPEERPAFLRALLRDGVVVLTSIPDSQGKVSFLDYSEGDRHVFPIFSSDDHAVKFLQSLPHAEVTPYQRLTVAASFLLENDWSTSRPVLNPRSRSETEITAADLDALRQLARRHGGK